MKMTHSKLSGIILTIVLITSMFLVNMISSEKETKGLPNRVKALETRIPQKGFMSISPIAFLPWNETQKFTRVGGGLVGSGISEGFVGSGAFWANLQLPHGAIITNMTVYLTDGVTDGSIYVYLQRRNLPSSSSSTMAWVQTGHALAPGHMTLYNDTIGYAEIDNQNCIYTVEVVFYVKYFAWNLILHGVVLEYEYLG